jgi:hypothetical protein
MGSPNPSMQKRAKEQKRKEKAEAKRALRDSKRTERPASTDETVQENV